MKISITMKDPDSVYDAIRQAASNEVEKIEGLTEEERAFVCARRTQEADKLLEKWFSFGELITIEIDTEAKTCTVLEKE